MKNDFRITFWGVRGSCPIPGKDTLIYGGNTSCVEIEINGNTLIFDAGTGLINFGKKLMALKKPVDAHLFITHTHWDHINGFPFFTPAFISSNCLTIYGEHKNGKTLKEIFGGQMTFPYFPVPLEIMSAQMKFIKVTEGDKINIDGIIVSTLNTNHPDGCIVYRVDYKNKSCCYITDVEHNPDHIDYGLVNFIRDSDVVIYDTFFTEDNFIPTWGHSTYDEGIKLVKAANAKKLVLFHHNISYDDETMAKIEKEAREKYSDSIAAREGLVLYI